MALEGMHLRPARNEPLIKGRDSLQQPPHPLRDTIAKDVFRGAEKAAAIVFSEVLSIMSVGQIEIDVRSLFHQEETNTTSQAEQLPTIELPKSNLDFSQVSSFTDRKALKRLDHFNKCTVAMQEKDVFGKVLTHIANNRGETTLDTIRERVQATHSEHDSNAIEQSIILLKLQEQGEDKNNQHRLTINEETGEVKYPALANYHSLVLQAELMYPQEMAITDKDLQPAVSRTLFSTSPLAAAE